MKWYLLVVLVLLAGCVASCASASPRTMRRQADDLDRQADSLRQDAAEMERQQHEAAMAAETEQAAWLTSIVPTQTPVPTETPQPSATPTPQPTATELPAAATSTPEMVARAIQATTGPDSPKTQAGPVESEPSESVTWVLALAAIAFVLFVLLVASILNDYIKRQLHRRRRP